MVSLARSPLKSAERKVDRALGIFVSGGVVADEVTMRFGGHLKNGPAAIGCSADEAGFGPVPPAPFNSFFGRPMPGRVTVVRLQILSVQLTAWGKDIYFNC